VPKAENPSNVTLFVAYIPQNRPTQTLNHSQPKLSRGITSHHSLYYLLLCQRFASLNRECFLLFIFIHINCDSPSHSTPIPLFDVSVDFCFVLMMILPIRGGISVVRDEGNWGIIPN